MRKDDSRFSKSGSGTYGVKPSARNAKPAEPHATEAQEPELKKMSYSDAAVKVLGRNGKPMHGSTIRDEIIAQALIKHGKCPTVSTVVGVISDEVNGKKGKHSSKPRMQSTSLGCYGLVEWENA